jgi:glycosyltransferase involved in cell wall biosynthesis
MRTMNTPNETLHVAPALSIALVTETYVPEVNGVAITIGRMVHGLLKRGHRIHMVRPRQGKQDAPAAEGSYAETLVSGMPIPGYPELKSGLPAKNLLLKLWRAQQPDVVHIATEGPLGWSALSAARKLGIPVCTDFHTNFHNYTQHYGIGLLKKPIAAYLRHFHNKAACTLVPTASLQQQLEHEGYQNVLVVSRGVDTELFHPAKRDAELRASWNADEVHQRYLAGLHERAGASGHERRRFLPRKGDALIWSADLAHGGSPVADDALTRKSLVCHYSPADVRPYFFYQHPVAPAIRPAAGGAAYCSSYYGLP